MVSEPDVFALDGHDVLYSQAGRGENVGLKGEAIPVAAADLKDGLDALVLKKGTPSQGTGFQDGIGHFRNHDRVQAPSHSRGAFHEG
jgi:hypothetical protein